ncbi:hypothetical protein ACJJIG_17840 [Microbulbifer sp. SSSA007]|uniref:hypothetical protein n=1 Tax=Microbulbifer sp. SSSA007 TaxID=3243379 RepID=UPI00403A0D29
MDLEQRAAERAFRKWGKPAIYNDGGGGKPIECRVIPDKSIDDFADDRVRTPRDEFSLLISEVGPHSSDALISFNSVEHKVRKLLEDDGIVRRVQVDGLKMHTCAFGDKDQQQLLLFLSENE